MLGFLGFTCNRALSSESMNNKFIQIDDNGEGLIEIPRFFIVEPMYFKQGLTSDDSMLLREGIVEKLLRVKRHLPKGWNFKIWDGYRPLSVQDKLHKGLWDLRSKENPSWDEAELKKAVEKFVAFPSYDPAKPSPHNTGGAVDLTIVTDDGIELPMGTEFDEFHERSYSDYFLDQDRHDDSGAGDGASFEARVHQSNRDLLRELIASEGFAPYKWEWWHFSFGNQDWAAHSGNEVAIYGSKEL
jgi:zinc D-Ala-D-Ala dipeptidase